MGPGKPFLGRFCETCETFGVVEDVLGEEGLKDQLETGPVVDERVKPFRGAPGSTGVSRVVRRHPLDASLRSKVERPAIVESGMSSRISLASSDRGAR